MFKTISAKARFIASLFAGALLSVSANANLLDNGGFEEPEVANGTWKYYLDDTLVPGWTFGDSSMEIWDSLLGVDAYEGEQLAELNAHGANNTAYSFLQEFDTIIGQTYNFGFAYRARSHSGEAFTVEILNVLGLNDYTTLYSEDVTDHVAGPWSLFTGSFVAQESRSAISFTSMDGLGDTTGNLLDDVYVTVPEPGSLALLGLGLFGLGMSRRKARK